MVYKLTYFNVKGLGEPIRYILAYAGVDFEDNRIEKEDWLAVKDDQPFRQLPVLDTGDAFLITQSVAIARYLGKTFNLMGRDEIHDAQLDSLVDHMRDIHTQLCNLMKSMENQDSVLMARSLNAPAIPPSYDDFEENVLKFYFTKFNAIAAGGALFGSEITWADVYFTGFMDSIETKMKKELLTNYPNLSALMLKIQGSENVQKYLEKRPFTSS